MVAPRNACACCAADDDADAGCLEGGSEPDAPESRGDFDAKGASFRLRPAALPETSSVNSLFADDEDDVCAAAAAAASARDEAPVA